MKKTYSILLVLITGTALRLEAQASPGMRQSRTRLADSSVATLMRLARRGMFPSDAVLDILRQRHGSFAATKRQELADSLVALAIRTPSAFDVVSTLSTSGMQVTGLGGQADLAALDRLVTVFRRSNDRATRHTALTLLAFQTRPGRAIPFLGSLAASNDGDFAGTAALALRDLAYAKRRDATSADSAAAAAALRALYDAGRAQGLATVVLCQTGAMRNWPPSAMCLPPRR